MELPLRVKWSGSPAELYETSRNSHASNHSIKNSKYLDGKYLEGRVVGTNDCAPNS